MSDRMSDKKADAAPAPKTAANAELASARAALASGGAQAGKAIEPTTAATRGTSVPSTAVAPAPVASSAVSSAAQVPASALRAIEDAAATAVATETALLAATTSRNADPARPVEGERFTKTITSTMERAMTTTEDLLAFGQANVEAFVKSGQIWASGMQDLGRHVAQSAQAHFDGTMSTMKALAAVKSVHEAIELQSSAARTALEKAVQDGGKLTDASLKLAEQTLAPISARVSVAAERFGRVAA